MSAVPEACGNTLADSRELSLIYPKPMKIQNLRTQEKMARYISTKPCLVCNGKRLKPSSLAVTIDGKNIIDITDMSVEETLYFFQNVETKLNERNTPFPA
jgi:excinuclease UvrABC ATPase subunit